MDVIENSWKEMKIQDGYITDYKSKLTGLITLAETLWLGGYQKKHHKVTVSIIENNTLQGSQSAIVAQMEMAEQEYSPFDMTSFSIGRLRVTALLLGVNTDRMLENIKDVAENAVRENTADGSEIEDGATRAKAWKCLATLVKAGETMKKKKNEFLDWLSQLGKQPLYVNNYQSNGKKN